MDDLTKRGPKDANKVNLSEPWEVEYWTRKFKCTEIMLRKAVAAAGPMVADIQKWLDKQRDFGY